MKTSKYIKTILLVLIILIVAPLYILVQGYGATFATAFMNFFGVSTKQGIIPIVIGLDFIGAFAVASITALPTGYMFPKGWFPISIVLAAITVAVLVFTGPTETARNWFMAAIRGGEYVSAFIAYFVMALVGSRVCRHTVKRPYNQCVHPIAEKAGSG